MIKCIFLVVIRTKIRKTIVRGSNQGGKSHDSRMNRLRRLIELSLMSDVNYEGNGVSLS